MTPCHDRRRSRTSVDVSELMLTPDGDGSIRYSGPAARDLERPRRWRRLVTSSEGDDTHARQRRQRPHAKAAPATTSHIGGAGDDILMDMFGDDVMKGGPGNDAISGGSGPFDLLQGNEGNDFIVGGNDAVGGLRRPGQRHHLHGRWPHRVVRRRAATTGWRAATRRPDLLVGDENNQFQNDPNGGHDVIIAGKGDEDFDAEGGDDIMVGNVLGNAALRRHARASTGSPTAAKPCRSMPTC